MANLASRPRPRLVDAMPEVNSRQLRAVLAVAEYRSFIAAAAYLRISQPALTLAIKRLEKTLGLPLFQRNTRQVTITAAGREFAAMAERVLNDLRLSLRGLQELGDRQRGRVIVTSLMSIPMSGVIAEYSRRFPGIEIDLREGFEEDVRDDLRAGIADFAIGTLGDLPASQLAESLRVEAYSVVLRRDHPLARARQIEFKSLKDVALVSLATGSTTRRLIDAAATAAGFSLRHTVTVGLPLTLTNLVRGGVGVAIVPAGRWPRSYKELVSRPLVRPTLVSEIGIIRLRDRELSPAATGLLSLARERLRNRPPQ